jgi:hypothetical protein
MRLLELRWAKSLTTSALNSLREELQAEGKGGTPRTTKELSYRRQCSPIV